MTEAISSDSISYDYSNSIQNLSLSEQSGSNQNALQLKGAVTKSTDEIVSELKNDGSSSSKSVAEIADEYGISYSKAREVYDEVYSNGNGITQEIPVPEGSTISYRV